MDMAEMKSDVKIMLSPVITSVAPNDAHSGRARRVSRSLSAVLSPQAAR
jgi:hypothetical protein